MKLKKNDNVTVSSGKDRGKSGKVLKVFMDIDRVLVEGVNVRKKHQRSKKQDKKGEIITRPAPIHVSNAMLVCPKCGKATRLGYKVSEGRKSRVCKKCSAEI